VDSEGDAEFVTQPESSTKRIPLTPTGDITGIVELGAKLQAEASQHNIHNVFDDGGYKELLILTLFNLKKLSRIGDDAVDADGRQYEIKTVARVSATGKRKSHLSITTEHTLTIENLQRYRNVQLWIVAVFDQAQPEAIYEITPAALDPTFRIGSQG
jgi:Restriction endonuclease PvuII